MFWYTELDLGKQNGFLYCGMDLVTVEDLTISNLEKFLQSVPDFTKIISSHPIVGRDGMGGVYFCSFVDNPGPNIFYWDHDFDDFSVVRNDWQSILKSKQLSWLLELSQIIGETVSSFTSSPPPKLTTPVPPQVLGAIYSFGEYITELNKSVFTQKGFTVYGVNIENNQIKELLQDKESEYYKYSYVSASINAEIVHNYHSYFLSNNLHLLQELLTVTKEIKGGLYQVIRHIFVELLAGKPNYGHLSYEMIEKISKEGKLPYSL